MVSAPTSPSTAAASVVATPVGDAAVDALHAVLARQRSGGPLSPALVVCGQPLVAVGLRRALGAQRGGIAGVDVVTSDRLIEELSRPILAEAGQRPASPVELQAAIRRELAATPGRFGPVAHHRTTEERLVRLHREIVGLAPDDVARLEAEPGLAGDAVRVLRGAVDRLGKARTEDRLLEYALEQLEATPPMALGPIVVYLPEPEQPIEGRLLQALHRRDDTTVIVGLTGVGDVDRRHRERLNGWGVQLDPGQRPAVVTANRLETADADDEVRAAIRAVSGFAATGTPLSRMAILYPTADPYASLLHDQLDSAGLERCGPGHRPLTRSAPGRTLLRLLQLRADGLERSAVINLVLGSPVRDANGRLVASAQWDRLSRQAGVIDDDDWSSRLGDLARGLEARADRGADLAAVHGLRDFVEELRERLSPEESPVTWWDLARWAIALLRRYTPVHTDWPEVERVAHERIVHLLERLAVLDRIDPEPTFEGFLATVEAELESAKVPGRPMGSGVLVAPVGSVPGLSFDRVVLVGAAEGIFPRTRREDTLLPDQAKALVGGKLLPKSATTDLDVRAAAVALGGSRMTPLVVSSRGDLRSNRDRVWPRLLDPLVEAVERIDSHHQGLVHHGRPASIEDLGLRSLIVHTDAGNPVNSHEYALADAVLAAGLRRHLDRQRPELTMHSGRVARGMIDPTQRLMSATALEDYATCPRRYLFGRVLRLGEEERPERIDEITPRDRGSLVHDILDRFLGEEIADGRVPEPGDGWAPEQVARLLAVGEQALAEKADQGVTGGRVQTELLKRAIVAELLNWVVLDQELRADFGSRPHATELEFGFDEPDMVTLADGRQFPMRGAIDRVDLTDDGGVMVIDYKGGSDQPFAKLQDDPLKGGQRLQLPLYARVVAERLGRTGPRTALYWLTKSSQRRVLELDADLDEQLDVHVGAALDGIGGGLFPGLPGISTGWPRLSFENCKYCDFDRICPTDRQAEWDRVQHDPNLTPIDVLLGRAEEAQQ